MTAEQARRANVVRLMQRAQEALDSARSEADAGRTAFAMNRAYYACFYAGSAVLLQQKLHFVKHGGVRAALHRDLVKAGRLPADVARIFDDLMGARHEADYGSAEFAPQDVEVAIERAEKFVRQLKGLMPQ